MRGDDEPALLVGELLDVGVRLVIVGVALDVGSQLDATVVAYLLPVPGLGLVLDGYVDQFVALFQFDHDVLLLSLGYECRVPGSRRTALLAPEVSTPVSREKEKAQAIDLGFVVRLGDLVGRLALQALDALPELRSLELGF